MGPVTLLVGRQTRDDWDLEEVHLVMAEKIEERPGRALYRLPDGRHLMYAVEGDEFFELYECSPSGRRQITLEAALA